MFSSNAYYNDLFCIMRQKTTFKQSRMFLVSTTICLLKYSFNEPKQYVFKQVRVSGYTSRNVMIFTREHIKMLLMQQILQGGKQLHSYFIASEHGYLLRDRVQKIRKRLFLFNILIYQYMYTFNAVEYFYMKQTISEFLQDFWKKKKYEKKKRHKEYYVFLQGL